MTVTADIARWDYTGNGVLVTYPFTAEIYTSSDLKVYVSDTLQVLNVDYTIAVGSIGVPAGGNVVFDAGSIPALSAPISLILDLPLTQLVDYIEGDKFPAEVHEKALDRIIKIAQSFSQTLSRVAKLPVSSLLDLIFPNPVANQYIGWNAAADNLENKALPVVTTATLYEVDALTSYGGGTSYTKATIDATLTAVGTVNPVTVLLRPGAWNIDADADYSAYENVIFRMPNGSYFDVDALMTLTIYSPANIIAAQNQQIFDKTMAGTVATTIPGQINPMHWGATGDGTTSDSAAINAAVAAVKEFGGIYFPPGKYRITDSIDFTGHKNFYVRGEFRNSFIYMDTTDTAGFNFYNSSYTVVSPLRGIVIENMGFYAATTTSDLPDYAVHIRNCPEIQIKNCIFIDASTVALLSLSESWSSEISFNYFSAFENITTAYGAPYNTDAEGACINLIDSTNAIRIVNNRIRAATTGGVTLSAINSVEIISNSIEGNTGGGIEISGAVESITISQNYFEGATQIYDIGFMNASDLVSINISENFFNAVLAIANAAAIVKGMTVENNNFSGMGTVYDGTGAVSGIGGTQAYYGVRFKNNTHTDGGTVLVPYLLDIVSSPAAYVAPDVDIDDIFQGTGADTTGPKWAHDNSNLMQEGGFSAASGVFTVTDGGAADIYDGVLGHVLSCGTSGYHKVVVANFDTKWRSRYVTIFIWAKTSDSRNQTIKILDGVTTKNYTVTSSATGKVSRIYYPLNVAATKLEIGFDMLNTNSDLTTLIPTVKLGLHSNIEFHEYRSSGVLSTLINHATPPIYGSKIWVTGGTTTITNFLFGYIGKVITIIAAHSLIITDGTNIFLSGSANWAMTATDTLTLIQNADGKWYEVGRGDNGA